MVKHGITKNKEVDKLKPDEFYWDNGKMVFTEIYHKRRGYCCNNDCRHCAYKHKKL
jgi:hypothetical protein